MKNPDNDIRPLGAAGCWRGQTNKRPFKISRKAEIVDTLVILIAGFLLPVWLIGQLFLTFYPPPFSTNIAEGGNTAGSLTNVSSSVELIPNAATGNHSKSKILLDSADESGSKAPNHWQAKFETISSEHTALTAESDGLKSSNDSLKAINASLEIENKNLHAKVKSLESANDFASLAETQTKERSDPDVVSQLQSQLAEMSAQLKSERADLMTATINLDAAQKQKRNLESKLLSLQSDLNLAEAKLLDTEKIDAKLDVEGSFEIPHLMSPDDDDQTATLVEANEKISTLKQNVGQLAQKHQTAVTALASREEALQVAQQTVATLTAQNRKLRTALDRENRQSDPPLPPALTKAEIYREFISSKGNPAKMAFIRWEGERILLRNFTNKKLYRLPLSRFSEADQRYLLELK